MDATGPRELEQAVTELTEAEVYWALNEAKKGLWFEPWFEELVQAAADRRCSAATWSARGRPERALSSKHQSHYD